MATSTVYDPIMNALLALLKATMTTTFLTYSRGIVMWENLSQVQNGQPLMRQPALFLYDGVGLGGGTIKYDQRGRSRPVVRTIDRTIVMYAQKPVAGGFPGGQIGGPDGVTTGGPLFHPLIEAVEAVFQITDREGALTLGGLVSHCWIEGDGMLISPDIDPQGQGMATLPVKIMVP